MANYAQVMWGGGILSSTTDGNIVYHSPLDSGATASNQEPISGAPFIKSYLSGVTINNNGEVKPSGETRGANITDADAYVMESGGTIHVFKSDCTSKMRCYYNPTGGATKLINDNRDIWYASISNEQFNISCNYDKYNEKDKNNNLRISDGQSTGTSFVFSSDGEKNADFYFLNYENGTYGTKMKIQTTQGMFSGCTDLTACEIPCKMRVISDGTFADCTSLFSYTRNPNFIESIGVGAFSGCTSMITLLIPKYASINTGSFKNCASATHIKWDGVSGMTYPTKGTTKKLNASDGLIPDSAFENCTSLRGTILDNNIYSSISIPSGYTRIGENAFKNDTSINWVTFNGVHTIGSNAFHGDSGIDYVEGFNTVSGISEYAFSGCTKLKGMDYTENVNVIGKRAFNNTKLLSGFTFNTNGSLSIGEFAFANSALNGSGGVSLTNISANVGQYAFSNCSATTVTVNIPTISGHMFSGCSKLSNLTLGNSVNRISDYAFSNCTSLGEVVIPDSTTDVIDGAFSNCSSLSTVYINNQSPIFGENCFKNCTNLSNIVFNNYSKAYKIYNSAFENCTSLTQFNGFGYPLNTIGASAFCYTKLSDIVMVESYYPNKTTKMSYGDYCFANIGNYCNSVKIESGVSVSAHTFEGTRPAIVSADCDTVDAWFSGNTNLKELVIGDNTKTIGTSAFTDCTSLSSLTIGNSVTNIESRAFKNCQNLTSITIPNSVTDVKKEAFRFCESATTLDLGQSISAIGERAFGELYSLKGELVIPDSVKTLGGGAFTKCASQSSGLTEITIGSGVTSIPSYCFTQIIFDSNSIGKITIPSTVTSIGSQAFNQCKNVDAVYSYNPEPPGLGAEAFDGIAGNKILYVPSAAISAYTNNSHWHNIFGNNIQPIPNS